MNMKKVLAVVMAVMLAISAMAISVFAAEYEITLSAAGSKGNGAAYSTVEFTIPVWAQYGYAVAGDTIKLSLPSTYTKKVDNVDYTVDASYVVVANGVSYALGLNADGVYEIVFGTLAHGYNANDLNTVIPQSTVVGDNAALTVIGTWSIAKDGNGNEKIRIAASDFKYFTHPEQNNWNDPAFNHKPNWRNDPVGSESWVFDHYDYTYEVKAISNDNPNSVSYCWDWNPVNGQDIAAADTNWNAGLTNLKWDATLINKAQVIGAETAKIVLKLDRAIVGNYYFGLNAVYTNGLAYDLSSNYLNVGNETKAYAAYVEIEEPTDTITFEVPKAVLYSTNYGVFNEYVTIECIDFFHTAVMDAIKAQVKAGILNGTLGDYSWTAWGTGDNNPAIKFCGQDVNNYWNQWSNANPQSVTLVLGYTDVETPADDIVVEDPVESTEEESEDITVEEPVEETNPGTGLALAVVPMVLAAAAVVASKRR